MYIVKWCSWLGLLFQPLILGEVHSHLLCPTKWLWFEGGKLQCSTALCASVAAADCHSQNSRCKFNIKLAGDFRNEIHHVYFDLLGMTSYEK